MTLRDQGPTEITATHGTFPVMRTPDITRPPIAVRFTIDGSRIVVEGSGIDVQFPET